MGADTTAVIKWPEYTKDARLGVDKEHRPPSDLLYIGLGWDEDRTTKRKHYRQFYNDELEFVTSIFPKPSPFNTYEIKKGQSRGLSGGFLSNLFKTFKKDDSGQASSEKVVGSFKGIIEVESKERKEWYQKQKNNLLDQLEDLIKKIAANSNRNELEINISEIDSTEDRKKFDLQLRQLNLQHLNITKHLADLQSDEILKRELLESNKCIVRLYVIEAFNLSSRDNGSASDPYLWIQCNNKVVNQRDQYQLDEPNPKFYTHFDFEGTFPGCSPLEICIYDYDDIFGDDLIGKTIIDLEDRFFCTQWRDLREKPVEYRQIYH